MFRSTVLALCVSVATAASASEPLPTCPPEARANAPIKSEVVALPPKGTQGEAEIGQSIISAATVSVHPLGLQLLEPAKITGKYFGQGFDAVVPPSALAPVVQKGAEVFPAPEASFQYRNEKKPRTGGAAPTIALVMDPTSPSGLTGQFTFGIPVRTFPVENTKFRTGSCLFVGGTGFRREIVYSGVSKGTVSLLYREYSGDMARPAFSQELTYDLSEGDEIGYRGARFKVLKATNTSIHYVVLKPLADG